MVRLRAKSSKRGWKRWTAPRPVATALDRSLALSKFVLVLAGFAGRRHACQAIAVRGALCVEFREGCRSGAIGLADRLPVLASIAFISRPPWALEGGYVSDELLSLRVVLASAHQGDHDLFRQAASASAVPIEIIPANRAAAFSCAPEADLVFLDAALASEEIARVIAAARDAAEPPFTVLLAGPNGAAQFATDALAEKPASFEEAKRLMERAMRVRLPSRVLVVDDSPTMRSIVCKILAATRFPLEVTEAEQGISAIELARHAEFHIVFLDHNMPGFSGLETIAAFRRERRSPTFVLMTSTPDDALEDRARQQGAAFLKKPFFPADIEAVLCSFYGMRALNPRHA